MYTPLALIKLNLLITATASDPTAINIKYMQKTTEQSLQLVAEIKYWKYAYGQARSKSS